jgi:trk system potassium uptake protein TrkA
MYKVAIFGLGKFGSSVALHLYEEGAEVLAVDASLRLVEEIRDKVSEAAAFDATSKANLEAYNIGQMDCAVVAIGDNFAASVLVTLLSKEMGAKKVVAKALDPLQKRALMAVGADQVVLPEEEMGHRVAEHLLHESVVDFVELPEGYSLRRIKAPPEWVGRSLLDLQLLQKERLNVVQIVRGLQGPGAAKDSERAEGIEPERIPLPYGPFVMEQGDHLDVIGPDKVLNRYA